MDAQALEHYEAAQKHYRIFVEQENPEDYNLRASIAQSLGVFFMRLKNYKDALEQFIECYEISREHLDKPPLDTFKMLSDIGDCEYHLKQYPHSIDSFKCAETVARKYPQDIPTSYISHALRRIGDAHLKMNEAEDALEYLQRAKEKGTGSLSSSEMAQVVVSIASCNLALSNFDQAIDDNKLAIELHSKDHNKRSNLEISRCYFFMGTAHLKVV